MGLPAGDIHRSYSPNLSPAERLILHRHAYQNLPRVQTFACWNNLKGSIYPGTLASPFEPFLPLSFPHLALMTVHFPVPEFVHFGSML